MISILVAALAAAAPQPDFYEFKFLESPVGYVSLSQEGNSYRYTSVHLYTRGDAHEQKARSETIQLDAKGRDGKGFTPASWALWRGAPQKGCIDVKDELTKIQGKLCVTKVDGASREGQILGKPFQAVMEKGRLSSLRIGDAQFTRMSKELLPEFPEDLSGDGFPVKNDGPRARIEPPVTVVYPELKPMSEARARELVRIARADSSPEAPCLARARAYRKLAKADGAEAAIVVGLHLENDRAYPHAWVRVQTENGPLELDPTLQTPVGGVNYLPLAVSTEPDDDFKSGAYWISFLKGTRRVVRSINIPLVGE